MYSCFKQWFRNEWLLYEQKKNKYCISYQTLWLRNKSEVWTLCLIYIITLRGKSTILNVLLLFKNRPTVFLKIFQRTFFASCLVSITICENITWNTRYLPKQCLTHWTTYSVSDSVSSTGRLEDLNSDPRLENSGTAPNCSETNEKEWNKTAETFTAK